MEENKENDIFADDAEEIIPLDDDEEAIAGAPEKRFGWKNVLFLLLVFLLAAVTILFLFWNLYHRSHPSEALSSTSATSQDASETMMQNGENNDSVLISEIDSSISNHSSSGESSEEEPSVPDEQYHGWIINNLGYTYLYYGIGVEQFNYSDATMNKYLTSIQELTKIVPSGTSVYCMPVPTRIGFLYSEISSDIKREDNFFNSSEQTFLDTVEETIGSGISVINLYHSFADAYQKGDELFFRTDSNWTADAAYLAYKEFCTSSGNAPITLAAYEENSIETFLGSFYTATSADVLRKNADVLRYYRNADTDACKVTLYNGSSVYKNYCLAGNAVMGISSAYSVYLGTTGEYFKIESPCTSGKSLLIVGDGSVAAMLPYLIENYSEIHYINVAFYRGAFSSLFESTKFHDVLFMSYVTNAVKGDYPIQLATMAGVQQDE